MFARNRLEPGADAVVYWTAEIPPGFTGFVRRIHAKGTASDLALVTVLLAALALDVTTLENGGFSSATFGWLFDTKWLYE